MKLGNIANQTEERHPILQGAFWTVLGSIFLWLVLYYSVGNFLGILSVFPDDAGYYFKIAQNVSLGNGLTFDGINRTNGFQPLWLYLLVGMHALLSEPPEVMYRIAAIIQLLFLACAMLLIAQKQRVLFPRPVSIASNVAFLLYVVCICINGMESALLIMLIAILFVFGWNEGRGAERTVKSSSAFGAILGLVILARLDMIFLAIAICGALFFQAVREPQQRIQKIKNLSALAFGTSCIVAPYLLFNLLRFGDAMPISGILKSSFPHIDVHDAIARLGNQGIFGAACGIGYLVWACVAYKTNEVVLSAQRRYYRNCMVILSTTILLHALNIVLFMPWGVISWHFAAYDLLVAVAITEPLYQLYVWGRRHIQFYFVYWAAVSLVVVVTGFAAYTRYTHPYDHSWRVTSYNAAIWTSQHTDASVVLGMKDAGNFGYFSRRKVVNLDGLANSMAYQTALKEQGLRRFLKAENVSLIVQHALWDRDDIDSGNYDTCALVYDSHKYPGVSCELTVHKADEVYRSPLYWNDTHRTTLLIWTIHE